MLLGIGKNYIGWAVIGGTGLQSRLYVVETIDRYSDLKVLITEPHIALVDIHLDA
jgi:hypothetical protein